MIFKSFCIVLKNVELFLGIWEQIADAFVKSQELKTERFIKIDTLLADIAIIDTALLLQKCSSLLACKKAKRRKKI